MNALVYHGPGAKAWEEVADPKLAADTDAIIKVDATTICGTDLHILKGDVPAMIDGVQAEYARIPFADTSTAPAGLSAIKGAHLFSPSHIIAIDMDESRLVAAKAFGADVVVHNTHDDPGPDREELTGGLGADVAIEAVGLSATFTIATTNAPRRSCGQRRSIVSDGAIR